MGDRNATTGEMGTYFAPAPRASEEELSKGLHTLSRNAVVDNLMTAVQGLLAILNEQRQILVVNNTLLDALGIQDGSLLRGLRPGEAVGCKYAGEERGGCGTSKFCKTCGAVCAMIACLKTNQPVETECAIATRRDGKVADLYFRVRCAPVEFDGQRFLLLLLQDTTVQQQRAALERVFYHDVSNVIESLLFNSRLLQASDRQPGVETVSAQIHELALRLANEVRVQKILSRGPGQETLAVREVSVAKVFRNLVAGFRNHPVAKGKSLVTTPAPDVRLHTDASLLERVVSNMLTNAFEATEEGGEVRFWVEEEPTSILFCVWNSQSLSEDVARRVFQRNYTTKPGSGRGLGTFGMRLLGETYLRGQVTFTTRPSHGTQFTFRLPREPSCVNPPMA